jgi:glycosyltransferase involved in cell wall biosynthesis
VVHGSTGFLAQSDADVASSLDRLLRDAVLRQSFSAAAVRHTNQFDWDDIAARWSEVFEQVLTKRNPSLRQKAS